MTTSDGMNSATASPLGDYRQFDRFAYANLYYGVMIRSVQQLGVSPDHNIVGYRGTYYAVPHGVPVDWTQLPDPAFDHLATGFVLDEIRKSAGTHGTGEQLPSTVGDYRGFNLVQHRSAYYGIPQALGELDWETADLAREPSVVSGGDIGELHLKIDDILVGDHHFYYLSTNQHHRGLSDFIATDQPLDELGLPEIIEIEPIHTCNLRCIMCHVSYEELTKQRLDIDKTLRHLEGVTGRWAMLASAYEPFAHPQIVDLIQGLDDLKMNIDMTTNGTLFTPKVIDQIKDTNIRFVTISFDGIRKQTYESIRGRANYDSAVERILNFRSAFANRDTYFNINQTLMRQNIHEVSESVEFWNEVDFDHMGLILMRVRYATDELNAQSLSDAEKDVEKALSGAARDVIENGHRIVLSSPAYANSPLKTEFPSNFVGSSVFSDNPGHRIPVNPREYYQNGRYPGMPVDCRSPFKFARINYNGDVILCQKFVIGNIHDRPFLDIWYGKEAARVRSGVMRPGNERTCLTCHHYKFCIRAGEIDIGDEQNFVSLLRAKTKRFGKAETQIQAGSDVEDGTLVFLGNYRLSRLYRWNGEFIAAPFLASRTSMLLDDFSKETAFVTGSSVEEVKAGVDRKIGEGVMFGPRIWKKRDLNELFSQGRKAMSNFNNRPGR